MNKKPIELSPAALLEISGGIGKSTIFAVGGVIWGILEIPHIIMGMREFANYTTELYLHGCAHDENDHFTKLFCPASES
jgi:hypothetical protein